MQYHIRGNQSSDAAEPRSGDERWAQHILRDVLLEAHQEQRRARLWRNLWRGVWLVVFLAIAVNIFRDEDRQLISASKTPHTAMISLTGVIGGGRDNQIDMLRDGLEAAYNNTGVKGIIIRADSPGGSAVVSNIIFNEIRRIKDKHKEKNIPLYVVAENFCASGCYYIAVAADKIYADPSSLVGSIGVISSSFDFTALMDKIGVKRRLNTAGSNKGMGDPFSPMTPEQDRIWQQMLDGIHQEFIKAVKLGRGNRLKEKENPDAFSGRLYIGTEAEKIGLIDGLGNIYSVAQNVVKAPKIVDYTPKDDFSRLFGRRVSAEISSALEAMFNKIW